MPYRSPFVRPASRIALEAQPMSETLLLVLALAIGAGVVAIIVLLLRPKPARSGRRAARRRAQRRASRPWADAGERADAAAAARQRAARRGDPEPRQVDEEPTKHTTEHLQQLHARLAVIDSAQKNITDLASQVTSLQNVLDNKQRAAPSAKGAWKRSSPTGCRKGAYEFQYTLSNNSRPDCVRVHAGQAAARHRRQISAGSGRPRCANAKTDDERRFGRAPIAPGYRQAYRRHRRRNI